MLEDKIQSSVGKLLRGRALCILAPLLLLAVFCEAQEAQQPLSPHLPPSFDKPRPDYHEDFTDVSLTHSVLTPLAPVFGQNSDNPKANYTHELWQLSWRPGDALDLYIVRPRVVAKPPVVIYLYGYPADNQQFMNGSWCEQVTARGFAAVGFVSALTGHRLEHRSPKDWFVSEMQEALASSAHDVEMILNFLESRGDFDMDHVGMYGQGSGGAIAILASSADSRLKAVEVLDPWGDWPNWVASSKIIPDGERLKYNNPEFLAKLTTLDPVSLLSKTRAKALHIVNIRPNAGVPEICQKNIEDAAPDFAFVDQFGDARTFVRTLVTNSRLHFWLESRLKPDAKPDPAAERNLRVRYYPPLPKDPGPKEFEYTTPAKSPQSENAKDAADGADKPHTSPR